MSVKPTLILWNTIDRLMIKCTKPAPKPTADVEPGSTILGA